MTTHDVRFGDCDLHLQARDVGLDDLNGVSVGTLTLSFPKVTMRGVVGVHSCFVSLDRDSTLVTLNLGGNAEPEPNAEPRVIRDAAVVVGSDSVATGVTDSAPADERSRRLTVAEARIAELEATLAEMSRTRSSKPCAICGAAIPPAHLHPAGRIPGVSVCCLPCAQRAVDVAGRFGS